MDPAMLPPWTLVVLVFVVAFFYASVGFGGASGYLAAMGLFALSTDMMASTALTLNIIVAGMAFGAYVRAGHFRARLLWPFLLTSVPMAFVGGYIDVSDLLYRTLLYLALAYLGVRLLLFDGVDESQSGAIRASWLWMLLSGAAIGLLSGMLGLGGGIFLSPLIVLSGWGKAKEAAASSAGFIIVNSVSSIVGRLLGGNFVFGAFGLALLPVGLAGGWLGSRWGAEKLSGPSMRRLLGAVLLLGVVQYFWVQFR
ncbi:MAG: TSUP family transporter [Caldilineaceae bacterium]